MNNRLAIIGASELQLPLINKAKEMGYETHVFAWKCGDIGEQEADFFYPISIVEKEEILNKCKVIKPKGIVSIASDLAVITVNYVSNKLGLVGNPLEDVLVTTNKFEMRKRLVENGILSPKYTQDIEQIEKNEMRFPLIIKPTDRSGSRGVTKVVLKEEIESAIERAKEYSLEKKVIIEEFIEGKEYSVEYVSQNGEHQFLTVTEKITTGAPNFVEIGHIQGKKIEKDLLVQIKKTVEEALKALNIRNGASHSEIMITKNKEIYIIEIGARMGGDCIGSDLVEISTGIDFLKIIIDISVNKKIELLKKTENNISVIKYIFDDEDLKIMKTMRPENLVRMSNIEKIDGRKIDESSKRYGFYILKFKNEDALEKQINDIINIR